jgi:hypothetical protein
MIYLGDGETDIPAMKMVKMQGGFTIAVYNENFIPTKNRKRAPKEICEEIVLQNRADFMAPANYLENSPLDILIKRCVDKIVAEQELNRLEL